MQAPNLCCLSVVALIGLSAPANAAGVQVLTGPGLHYEIGRLGVPSATVGAPDTKGALYTFFVRYDRGLRSPPHTHPDDRVITVLSGTLYVGSGFDKASLDRAEGMPAGTVFLIKGGLPHYGWAKDGPVTVQETGVGPTSTTLFSPQ